MKIYNKILLGSLISLGILTGCKNEDPFYKSEAENGTGRLLTSSIVVHVNAEIVSTKAVVQTPDAKDFTVDFNNTDTGKTVSSYKISQLPEVVTLPVGNYVAKVHYGNPDVVAEFDSPYYEGNSEKFSIINGKILDTLEPIICSLQNVRISIFFDSALLEVCESDAKVSVKVGDSGELSFYPSTESDGYFKYVTNSHTLAATFSGTVQGTYITENKTFDQINPGTYYRITFKLKNPETGSIEPGGIEQQGDLKIVASVTYHDYTTEDGYTNVDPDTEEYLEDDMRPTQPEDPKDEPTPDEPKEGAPYITSDDVDVNEVTILTDDMDSLVVKIISPTPITGFICIIDSSTLTPEELKSVQLDSELDLVNDKYEKEEGEEVSTLWQQLDGLGFPVGKKVTDAPQNADGDYEVIFDITQFVPMLNALGAGDHNFIFNLENEGGYKSSSTLRLKSLDK